MYQYDFTWKQTDRFDSEHTLYDGSVWPGQLTGVLNDIMILRHYSTMSLRDIDRFHDLRRGKLNHYKIRDLRPEEELFFY